MEFLSALTFSPDETGASKNSTLVPKYVVDICGALVEERPDTTLTFIHISVKEYACPLQSAFSYCIVPCILSYVSTQIFTIAFK